MRQKLALIGDDFWIQDEDATAFTGWTERSSEPGHVRAGGHLWSVTHENPHEIAVHRVRRIR